MEIYKIHVPTHQEIIDKAFAEGRLASESISGIKDFKSFLRRKEQARVETAIETAISQIDSFLNSLKNPDTLHPFYRDLIWSQIDKTSYKHAITVILNSKFKLRKLKRSFRSDLSKIIDASSAKRIRTAAYGRIASIIKDLKKPLQFFKSAVLVLRRLPDLNVFYPTIVIAGMPNVGKSTLLNSLTNAHVETASYPFTTKGIKIGIRKINKVPFQFIDTPGLLDRQLNKRNKVELQSIVALNHLANAILFLIDYSETCGYSVESQKSLLNSIRKLFKNKPLIVVASKSDLGTGDANVYWNKDSPVAPVINEIITKIGDLDEFRRIERRNWPRS